MNFAEQLQYYKQMADDALQRESFEGTPDTLCQAMRYSLLSPGKRLRACLCLAACEMGGGEAATALPFAEAVEMIHAYSLIHDDLPAMDNDTLRRGLPTNHVVYGEAMAILAGDALQSAAYEKITSVPGENAYRALAVLAKASGCRGMVAGQALDMQNEGTEPDKRTVEAIHAGKTAALITASVEMGLIMSGCREECVLAGRQYGHYLGMAFQIVDDLLDMTGDEKLLGKHPGKDEQSGKITWPACVGAEQAFLDAKAYIDQAVRALDVFKNKAEFLQTLAKETLQRVK